jgi:subtilisin family serine protease
MRQSHLALGLVLAARLASAQEAVPGEYIVKLRPASSGSQRMQIQSVSARGLDIVEDVDGDNGVFLARPRAGVRALGAKALIASMPEVESIEPNYVWRVSMGGSRPQPTPTPRPTATPTPTPEPGERASLPFERPDDSFFSKLWGLENLGQDGGKKFADIWATQAWKLFSGNGSVIVAVIDTGVDSSHPDLQGNLVPGYSPYDDSFDPKDENGHGTHCAGTIGARGDNASGVAGVNWNVKVMPIRFMGPQGSGTTADAIKGIDWAVEHGAKVLSNSWGGSGRSDQLLAAIERARDKGVLFIAAAGNESNDNDKNPTYPAAYKVDNMITVAASDRNEKLANFSNFGKTSVHLAAPGVDIYSTYKGATYRSLSGTSMATPHVAGAAALLWGYRPELRYAEVRKRLLDSTDKIPAYSGKTTTGGRLNVYRALTN